MFTGHCIEKEVCAEKIKTVNHPQCFFFRFAETSPVATSFPGFGNIFIDSAASPSLPCQPPASAASPHF